ncbi:MAG: glycosyltransferase family 1 protein [Ardenticatenia bacterium]|nr:glycosyltransferase family 1 protein [Ardenticatenia bacterium]
MNSVVLFRDHPAENWPSMRRYAERLEDALRHLAPSHLKVRSLVPPDPWPIPRGLLLRRMLTYPLWSRRRQGDLNHVLDHSYGHLLFGLDPERTVVTVHDIAPLLFPGKRLGMSQLAWQWAWRGALRAKRLIADSDFTRRLVIKRFRLSPERIVVVPLGVESAFRPLPEEAVERLRRRYAVPEAPLLLYVGNTQPRKNLEGLLRALAILWHQNPRVMLLQVGKPPTARQRALVESLGLRDAVHFLGLVPDADLVAFYNLADVFVFPSLYEGFGLPPLEAMACGTPVVASHAASLPEVVGDAGLLVDPRDPEAMAEAIHHVLQDPELAEELRRRGLERARQFTWERTAQETLAVYEAMLGNSRGGSC